MKKQSYFLFIFIAEDEEDVIYMFRELKDTYDEWVLKINMNKIEHLTTSLKADILLDIINIKIGEEFKNLGFIIHQDAKGRKAISVLNLLYSNSLPKRIIYSAVVLNILL